MVIDSKENLRALVKNLEIKENSAEKLAIQISRWSVFQNAERIAFYIAMNDEIDLRFLFSSEKKVFLPRFIKSSKMYEMAQVEDESQLIEGKYGINEPSAKCPKCGKSEIDLWFIPGMAFTKNGHRLGRGAGFYDRLLEGENGLKAGVCSSDRILEEIPLESHDIKMDFVLTDKEILKNNN